MRHPPPVPPEFHQAVLELLSAADDALPASWHTMQWVQDLQDTADTTSICTTQHVLKPALNTLQNEKPLLAKTLQLRFRQGMTVREVGQKTHRSPASVQRDIQTASKHLSRILWQQEFQARTQFQRSQLQHLEPPTWQQLFGVGPLIDHLLPVLTAASGPKTILLTGTGGLGKTSLADYLSRELIARRAFRGFAWISLRPQISLWDTRPHFQANSAQLALEQLFEQLSQQILGDDALPIPFSLPTLLQRLHDHLQEKPHFIVIDNLETLNLATPLLTQLQQLPASTHILITSRVSLPQQPQLYLQQIPALNQQASLQLLRDQGERRNIVALRQASQNDLIQIFHKVGGNPLALKLIAGQLHTHAISTLLQDLTLARGTQIQRLYHYIFQRAWDHLSPVTRQIFLATTLLPPAGGSLQHLCAITQKPEAIVHDALESLVRRNLVHQQHQHQQTLYAIHNLTRTFLQQHFQSHP